MQATLSTEKLLRVIVRKVIRFNQNDNITPSKGESFHFGCGKKGKFGKLQVDPVNVNAYEFENLGGLIHVNETEFACLFC